MKHAWAIKCFACIEIILGITSLFFTFFYLLSIHFPCAPAITTFLVTSALISIILGAGILNYNIQAYYLLIFFSGVIVLSKILILSNIISLNQTIASTLSFELKNTTSFIYHCLLIIYFTRKSTIDIFKNSQKNAKL
jgi:uncharacterized membrane protein